MSFNSKNQLKMDDFIKNTYKFGEICEVLNGRAYKKNELLESGKYTVLRVGNFFSSDHWYYSDLELDANKYCDNGDLLFAWSASFGPKIWDGGKVIYHYHIWKLVPSPFVDTKFLYYWLLFSRNKMLMGVHGSVMGHLTKSSFEKQKISLPDILEQKAIAHILSTLDDRIEVNNQINKTLENMAQAIFKQWFVDFEFPNEEGEPYKSSGGEMFESELGMIPKGWEVKKSSDIANVNIGKTPPRKEKECFTLDPDDYKWISIKDLGNSGAYIFDSSEYLTKESIEKYNVKVVPDNTVVLSFKLTIGRVSITCGQMTTNEAIAHFNLSNKSKITTEYLYLYLKGFDYGKLGNTSSIANAVNSKIIKSMPIIVPDNKTIKTFSEVMESVFSKIKYTIKQSDKLIEIRDSLLPKLMSGEIRVPLDEEGIVS